MISILSTPRWRRVGRAFGLDEIGLDKDVDELSGGQRTKVLLGKASS